MKLVTILITVILLSSTVIPVLPLQGYEPIIGEWNGTTMFLSYDRAAQTILFEWEPLEFDRDYCKFSFFVDDVITRDVTDPNNPRQYISEFVTFEHIDELFNVVKCADGKILVDVSEYKDFPNKYFQFEIWGQGNLTPRNEFQGCVFVHDFFQFNNRLFVTPDERVPLGIDRIFHIYNTYVNTPTENYRWIYHNAVVKETVPLNSDSIIESAQLLTTEQFEKKFPPLNKCNSQIYHKVDVSENFGSNVIISDSDIDLVRAYNEGLDGLTKNFNAILEYKQNELSKAIADNNTEEIERLTSEADSFKIVVHIFELRNEFIKESLAKYSVPR